MAIRPITPRTTLMKSPELLLPAGTLDKMRSAYAFGADAVYAGQPRYSLRARNNEFQLEELQTGIAEAHALGKKLFVASNLMPHNAKVKTYMADMEPVIAMRPDALIMADPGLIAMVRERWPEADIHLSVQANTVNYAAVKFWQSLGLSRVILSRELSLDEIEEIRQLCPDMELEVFVHGALCIAYSGRCLLSGYFNHRDANQGTCTNSCRWDYKVDNAEENGTGDIQKIDFDFDKALSESALSSCGSQPRHDHGGRLQPAQVDLVDRVRFGMSVTTTDHAGRRVATADADRRKAGHEIREVVRMDRQRGARVDLHVALICGLLEVAGDRGVGGRRENLLATLTATSTIQVDHQPQRFAAGFLRVGAGVVPGSEQADLFTTEADDANGPLELLREGGQQASDFERHHGPGGVVTRSLRDVVPVVMAAEQDHLVG